MRTARHKPKPSVPGISTSLSSAAGRFSRSKNMASLALLAQMTSKPALLKVICASLSCSGSSSTTTSVPVPPVGWRAFRCRSSACNKRDGSTGFSKSSAKPASSTRASSSGARPETAIAGKSG
ncbi:MAG: hypothetical protein QM756_16255 [Polyangiaceae bacterium]